MDLAPASRPALTRARRVRPTKKRARAAPRSILGRPPAWIAVLALVFAVALGWRLAYLARLSQTPLAGSLTADAGIYWDWAGWLRHHGLLGRQPFFLGPLYPYVLSGLRTLLHDSMGGVLVVQAIWGALAVVLLTDAAARLTRPAIALVVGALLCFYEMAVFYDGLILMESLLFFVASVLLWWVTVTDWSAARVRAYLGLGALIGVLAEGRASATLLLPLVAVLVPWRSMTRTEGARRLVAAVLGFALLTVPVAARNVVVARAWIPFTYNFGYNLYIGNNPTANGGSVPITGSTPGASYTGAEDGGGELDGRDYLRRVEGLSLTPLESSHEWARRAGRWIGAHPGAVARLALRKLGMLWSRREYGQIERIREFRAWAGPIGAPWVGQFAWLGVLALAGLAFAAAYGPAGRFALGMVVAHSLSILPFFVTDRYRIHLVPPAALLAAIAISEALKAGHSRTRATRAVLALACGVAIVAWPAPHADAGTVAWVDAVDRGERSLQGGDPRRAASAFEQAMQLARRSPPEFGNDVAQRAANARLAHGYGLALQRLGRADDALPWLERAAAAAPDQPLVLRVLADAYATAGRTRAADSVFARLDSLPGGAGLTLVSRGYAAARAGNFEAAERLFLDAVRLAPRRFEAWGDLIRVEVQMGVNDNAEVSLAQARDAGMPQPQAHCYAALIAANRGDIERADRELAQVPPRLLAADAELADVVRVARGILSRPGAPRALTPP